MSFVKLIAKKLRFAMQYIKYLHKFKSVGKHTVMYKPLRIMGGKNITIGDYSYIMQDFRIETINRFNDQVFTPEIKIGDRVEIGQGCHISCSSSVILEDDVTLAPHVMINDCKHGYSQPNVPIERQDLSNKPIRIGRGSLIGYGAVILPGVTIGEYSFVGAGCVIAQDVPDHTVVSNRSNLIMKSTIQ